MLTMHKLEFGLKVKLACLLGGSKHHALVVDKVPLILLVCILAIQCSIQTSSIKFVLFEIFVFKLIFTLVILCLGSFSCPSS